MILIYREGVDLDSYLDSMAVLDCDGSVRYRLTLLLNGNVRVAFRSGVTAEVNPRSRQCLTPRVQIPDDLWTEISAMSVGL